MGAVCLALAAAALAGCVLLVVRARRQGDRSPARTVQAAAGSVLLYVLAQSAVERRLVWALLLPVTAGRAAMLSCCLLLCLALALTERGRSLAAWTGRLCRTRGGRWLCAAAVTGLFFLWTLRVDLLCYMTMDDVTILHAIADVPREGLAAAAGAWSNILLCAVIAFFYRIAPDGYWYLGYHLTVLAISLVIIGRCLLVRAGRSGLSPALACAVHAGLCVGLFSYTLGGLSFTLTPAAAGAAAVALMLCREDADSLPALIASDLAGALLLFLCRLQRYSTMQAVICFWGLAAVYTLGKLLLHRGGGRRGSLASLAVGAALSLALCFLNVSAGLPQVSVADNNAEYYRSVVMDYLMDNLTDEQWEAVGIPPELAVMMRGWYFMDERVNTETFRELTELYYESDEAVGTGTNVMGTNSAEETAAIVRRSIVPAAAGLVLAVLLAAAAFFRGGRRQWPELLCAVCALGGAGILCAHLVSEGRFPLRVFLVVAIPAAVTEGVLLLSFPRAEDKPGKKGLRVLSGVLAAGLCLSCGVSAMGSPRADTAVTRAELFAEQWSMEEYALAAPDITFYTNMTGVTLDPLHGAYTYPENISVWGGSFFTVDDDHPCADAFFRDDVRLMVKPLSSLIAFLQYLTLDFGPVQAEPEARLADGILVVRISRAAPAQADYTGWFEENGFTYYYENGLAADGTRVIDGTEYTFAPRGAAAEMVTLKTDGGAALYTTNACALIVPGDENR